MKKFVFILILALLLATPVFAVFVSQTTMAFNYGYQMGEVGGTNLTGHQIGFGVLTSFYERQENEEIESKFDFGYGTKADINFNLENSGLFFGAILGPYFDFNINDNISVGLLVGPGLSITELNREDEDGTEDSGYVALGPAADVSVNIYPFKDASFALTLGSAVYGQFYLEDTPHKNGFEVVPYFAVTIAYTAKNNRNMYIY